MWILWKVSFENVIFWINWGFLPQCTSLQWIYTPKKGLISAQNSIFPFISSENPMCFWPKFHGNHKKSDQNQWSSEGVLVMHLDLKLEKWVQFQFSCPKTEFLNFSHIFFFLSKNVKKCNFSTKTEFLEFLSFFTVKSAILVQKLNLFLLSKVKHCKAIFIHCGDFLDQKLRLFEGIPSTVGTKSHPLTQVSGHKYETYWRVFIHCAHLEWEWDYFREFSTTVHLKWDNSRGFSPTHSEA